MIRAAILSLVLSIASVGTASAGKCGKLCDPEWWETATPEAVALEIATVDVNARGHRGSTPLHWTASSGTSANITSLLTAGAKVNSRSLGGQTPLHWTARKGTPASIIALLKAGASVNARDNRGYTPLHHAALFSNTGNIVVLLDVGADGRAIDEDGKMPFDLFKADKDLNGTDVYWALHEARYD